MSDLRFEGWEAGISPRGGTTYAVTIGGRGREVRLLSWEEGLLSLEILDEGESRTVHAVAEARGDRVEVTLAGRRAAFPLDADAAAAEGGAASGASAGPVRAELPGRVLEILVREGDLVEGGQVLAVVEAMKMEHPVRAGAPARVGKIHAEVGAQLQPGDVLLDLLPGEGLP